MLILENIHRKIGNTNIINGVDMEIDNGLAIGIVGPNGCGKTSLLNLINGFNQTTSGSITFNHKNITNYSIEKRAQLGIGRVFQSCGIFKKLTLFENLSLAFVNILHRKYKLLPVAFLPSDIKDSINAILDELNLYEKRNNLAGDLSGGQMRLLEIARLYLQDTKLYLLDEPTAGVSPRLKNKVIELLNKIIIRGKIVVIVEHDFEFLSQFVNKIYVMNEGKIILGGSHEEIRNNSLINQIYFGKSDKDEESKIHGR